MTIESTLTTFRERLGEVMDLHQAASVLHWDQEVFMPPKGAAARGRQLATLSAVAHRYFTREEMGRLLDELTEAADQLDPDDAKLVEVTRYDYERETKLPEAFVQAFALAQSAAYEAWVKARETDSFATFQPHLEKILDLLHEKADYLGYEGSSYNALLEEYERGMTVETLRGLFDVVAERQSALVEKIVNAPDPPDLAWTRGPWDEDAQWTMTLRLLQDMGYDFEAGRQDRSVHPFTTSFGARDVRLTNRVSPDDLFSALHGAAHEGGHGLYEQGFQEKDGRTPLADGISLGVHESQSRMWENMIGRSLPFWEHYAPVLRDLHPGRLDGITPQQFYQAVNHVQPSLIRVEADECTYNLHVILRFEIEVALMEGEIAVAEIPEAWNAKMKQYLGLDVPSDAQGCLQDIHWSHGSLGYFPTYALGNLYAAQLFEKILEDLPGLWDDVRAANFAPLLGWLRENVHRHGRRKTAVELIRDITGRPPAPGPYLTYLEEKYGRLYGLSGG